MKEKNPKVFVIVLNYNGGGLIENCLKSLEKVNYSNLHILVVDNNSSDDSVFKIEKKFSDLKIINNKKNFGFSKGNNVGIDFALKNDADYVLLLNQDTEVEPDFLSKLIKEGEKDNKTGLLSPIIFLEKTKKIWFSGGRINWWNMKAFHEFDLVKSKSFETSFLTGCSLLIKREVLEKIGPLDEDFFLYWEDVDYSVRAKKAGFKIKVVPESVIYHFESSNELNENKVYWLVLSGLIFFKKNTPGILRPWIWFFAQLRKLKNWIDRIFKKNNLTEGVFKAYKDFELWKKNYR
jgi:GT2 family glycosyltransferase